MYHDTVGGRNLKDKQTIEKAMTQRRLVYRDSMEAEFAEAERLHKQKLQKEAKKLGQSGTSGFLATGRQTDWVSLKQKLNEGPSATLYSPKYDSVKPVAPAYTCYRPELEK